MMEGMGERIRKARYNAGRSQAAVAEALGVSEAAVSRWECGSRLPDVGDLYELAVFLGVSSDYLLGLTP